MLLETNIKLDCSEHRELVIKAGVTEVVLHSYFLSGVFRRRCHGSYTIELVQSFVCVFATASKIIRKSFGRISIKFPGSKACEKGCRGRREQQRNYSVPIIYTPSSINVFIVQVSLSC